MNAKVVQTRRGNAETLLSDLRLVVVLAMALLLAPVVFEVEVAEVERYTKGDAPRVVKSSPYSE